MEPNTPSARPTHADLIADVLQDANTWLNREQIVDALNRAHPGWTGAKDRIGQLGIINRVLYTARADFESHKDLGLSEFYCGHRFEKRNEGGNVFWRLVE